MVYCFSEFEAEFEVLWVFAIGGHILFGNQYVGELTVGRQLVWLTNSEI